MARVISGTIQRAIVGQLPGTIRACQGGRTASFSSWTSILKRVEDGTMTAADAEKLLSASSSSSDNDISSFANIDHKRTNRTGFPEAIFAAGKTPHQIVSIFDNMAAHVNESLAAIDTTKQNSSHGSSPFAAILATRVDKDLFEEVSAIPLKNGVITYHETARIISMKASALLELSPNHSSDNKSSATEEHGTKKKVVVACAGTTDLPVAEEAAVTLEAAGVKVERVYDAGVAGLHRIINALPTLRDSEVGCVIVCAGMDGALPSVVGGLVRVPVIAVPTSIGYGASFGGISAMLTMLNSCAPGVGVVNIDNGFGGAALAFKCINN
eukprot:CAMPEP_0195509724 /NCGR_PEP_ID=MMETSP0794_2-20130614/2578_1 /TAXON_ID=515487 /ORGANISM="Stephanopyxis turris, Strain CCMP 815" /LENGTH=325 /DNA_ID=CAMNT_0040637011 /DNA_START=25 /DNA_END=1002 /DNA_ORIENTATION=+